ncbi:hypothetical protein D9758_018473 [Tetrapyrgos nigripes]|uniref:Peptidase C14 caspase domain-containing protein n=1 Tax=Tetrapyrgos nigripes TaxID=182062 RepID=A0A8H5F4G9_9AGAR|nr:hypothetical protein D9758_018473 [Tetrapyrgos nigripes]
MSKILLDVYSWLKKELQIPSKAVDARRLTTDTVTGSDALFSRALIIGIDHYVDPTIPDLENSVVDAYAFKQLLCSRGVQEKHIVVLCNESASCARIEEEVQTLTNSDAPVFMYFAGHGATGTLSSKSRFFGRASKADNVKMLIPHDFGLEGPRRGVLIQTLLSGLSERSVLFTDCCYPLQSPTLASVGRVRGISLPKTSLVTGTLSFAKNNNAPLPFRFFSWFLHLFRLIVGRKRQTSSCIFLSACRDGELAKESTDHGVFTEGLLRRLWCGNASQLTYESLSVLTSIAEQNALCEGSLRSSQLEFGGRSRLLDHEREHCFAWPASTPGECLLSVGHSLGVSPGAQFDLFADAPHSEYIGRLTVWQTSSFSSVARLSSSPPGINHMNWTLRYALRLQGDLRGGLRVLLSSTPLLRDQILESITPEIGLVDRDPDLVIACDSDRGVANLELFLPSIEGGFKIPFPVSASLDTLLYLLRSAEAFLWHIRTHGRHGPIAANVVLECRRLVATSNKTDLFRSGWIPESNTNLINDAGLLDAEVGQKYGFMVTNHSTVNIFCALLYFDLSDWSITLYYQTRFNEPLTPGGSGTFGYGQNFRDRPVVYFLREGQKVDYGFLKLLISTEYIDYFNLTQPPVLGQTPQIPVEFINKSRSMASNYILIQTIQR